MFERCVGLSFSAAILLVALAAPAQAQVPGTSSGNSSGGLSGLNLIPDKAPLDPAEQEKRDAIDKAYKDSLRKQSLQPATSAVDPWSNMRGNDPQPAAKSAAKTPAKKKPAAQ